MNKILLKNFLIIVSIASTVSACSKKESSDNFDLSNFKPRIKKSEIVKKKSQNIEEIKVINKLLPLKKRNEIYSSIKYGKKDPFSEFGNESNQFISNLKLKGFISVNNKNYALIEFKNKKGIINKNSVGGLNTKLLPKGVSVKNIDSSQEEINLSLGSEIYTIKLNI